MDAFNQLSEFEQITVEQLVSYRIAKREKESEESLAQRIEEKCQCPQIHAEVKAMVSKWQNQRKAKNLKAWT